MSKLLSLKSASRHKALLNIAKSLLIDDKVIAIPTDTIYGLAVTVNSESAIQRLYDIKTREFNKPLAICLADIEDIFKYSIVTVSVNLLKELLPGAVTVIFKRGPKLPPFLNPNVELVGIRVPNHDFIRDLCRVTGPIALTSANVSHESSCLQVEEFASLWPLIDGIFDGGRLGNVDPKRLGSTIIDLSCKGYYRILRDGCIYDQAVKILKKYNLNSL